jgi:Zn-dependent protease
LIPLSPLDGEKILYYLLPASGQRVMDQIRPYSPIILLVLVFGGMFLGFNLLGQIITPAMNAIMGVLVG